MTETTLERRPESSSISDKRASKPAWKKPWVWVVAVVVLAGLIAGIVYSLSGPSATKVATPRNPPATSPKGQQPLAGTGIADIGKPFSDGEFTFSVVGFDCSTVT